MSKKFLIITEGSVDEPNLLVKLFEKYGFNVIKEEKINVNINEKNKTKFLKSEAINIDKDTVIIAQGPRNRLKELVNLAKKQPVEFEWLFTEFREAFAGIFLIYDVDQTLNCELEEAFKMFSYEQEGLLLISSPCIEVLADNEDDRNEPICGTHLSKVYKPLIKGYLNKKYNISFADYVFENFEKIMLKYLEKNMFDFQSFDVLEHPSLIMSKVNKLNEREPISLKEVEFKYRYFSTVIYVCFAYILGLTEKFDNAYILREFLIKRINEEL